jgi:two-component system alkaline phosphatase synthesis response regulator PhoP
MPKKILLVEDDSCIIDIYETVLQKAGFEVETLEYGHQAQKRLNEIKEGKKEEPDLILLDLVLPDINGIEILKQARKEKGIDNIPFFILTNYTDPELEKVSRELKVEKYILKTDLVPSQLVKMIRELFEKSKKI